MALDFIKKIFKKKKEEEIIEEKKEETVIDKETEVKKDEESLKILNIGDEIVFHLIRPHITEKTSFLAGQNKYVFWVKKKANKIEIKKAIEKLYGVNVIDVNILNPKPKKIRLGRILGTKPVFKKAIVTIKEGQKIEIL